MSPEFMPCGHDADEAAAEADADVLDDDAEETVDPSTWEGKSGSAPIGDVRWVSENIAGNPMALTLGRYVDAVEILKRERAAITAMTKWQRGHPTRSVCVPPTGPCPNPLGLR